MPTRTSLEPNGTTVSPPELTQRRFGPFVGLIFGLLAAVLVFFVIERIHPVFTNEEDRDGFGMLPLKIENELNTNNRTFVLALLGGLLATGIAVGESVTRRTLLNAFLTALLGGLSCAVLCTAFGGLAGFLGGSLFEYLKTLYNVEIWGYPIMSELYAAATMYGTTLGLLGAGIGLGTGLVLCQGPGRVVPLLAVVGGAALIDVGLIFGFLDATVPALMWFLAGATLLGAVLMLVGRFFATSSLIALIVVVISEGAMAAGIKFGGFEHSLRSMIPAILGVGLAGGGLIYGRLLGGSLNYAVAGMIGGLLAGLAYPAICGYFLPHTDTQVVIPIATTERFIWCAVAGGLIGLCIPALTSKAFARKGEDKE